MIAHIDYITCNGGRRLPCAVISQNMRSYRQEDVDLIIAHRSEPDCPGPHDFVCSDEKEAFSRLKRIVTWLHPGIRVIDRSSGLKIVH